MSISNNLLLLVIIDLTCALLYIFIPSYLYASNRGIYKTDTLAVFLLLSCPLLLVSDALSWIFDGRAGEFSRVIASISYFVQYLIQYTMMEFVSEALLKGLQEVDGKTRTPLLYLVRVLYASLVSVLMINVFTGWFYIFDAQNRFVRFPSFLYTTVVSGLIMLGYIIVAMHNRKKLSFISPLTFATIALLILVATILQYVLHGISMINLIICVCITVLTISQQNSRVSMLHTEQLRSAQQDVALAQQNLRLEQQRSELAQHAAELANTEMQLLRTHMKPDFLFAALAQLQKTIYTDPTLAIDSIEALSLFLRRNIRPSADDLSTLPQEIELVESYLFLYQQQSGGNVRLELELDETDFSLPLLTLQPLVEASIYVGFRDTGGSGTITISSWWEDGWYHVSVVDDGTHFDPVEAGSLVSTDDLVKTLRQRIQQLCGGTMFAGLDPKVGITIDICIPDTAGNQ